MVWTLYQILSESIFWATIMAHLMHWLLLVGLLVGARTFRLTPARASRMRSLATATMDPNGIRHKDSSSPGMLNACNSNIVNEEEEEEEEEESVDDSSASAVEIVEDGPSIFKEGIKFGANINGSDVRVGIIMARWNADIIQGLYKGVNESLSKAGVLPSNVFTTYVPGAFELPITAKFLAASKRVDVIICLGCLIKGDTMHFEYIAQATASGIMQVSLETYVPCIFGVLTVLNKEQAIIRSTGEENEGLSWGTTAIEMGLARMSALGIGKAVLKDAEKQTPFVNFNATAPIQPKKEGDGSSKSKKKPFGF